MRERAEQEEQFAQEIEIARIELRAAIDENRQAEREELVANQEKEFMDLIAQAGSISSADLAQRKAEMKLKQKKQLAEFDAETEKKLKEVDNDPLSSLEVKHSHARLQLREKQLDELAGSMQQLVSEEELVEQYEKKAEQAAEAANAYRESASFDVAARIENMKKQRQSQSEEEKKRM